VRGSGAGYLSHIAIAAQAEAEACIHALKAASDWGMVAIHVEADSQNLIKALQGPSFDRAPEGILYRDMRIFMNLNFNSVCLGYVPRKCNNLAHAQAAYGASRQDLSQLWPESIPNDVSVRVASSLAEPVN
jgi:ribonuclease HI